MLKRKLQLIKFQPIEIKFNLFKMSSKIEETKTQIKSQLL